MLAAEQLDHALSHRAGRAQFLEVLPAPQVLADRDEFHLGRDDSAPRVVHLRDVGAGARTPGSTLQLEAQLRELRIGEALASEARGRAIEEDGVAPLLDPAGAKRREPGANVDARWRV